MVLDNRRGGNNSGLTGVEYEKLIRMLCIDFPNDIITHLLDIYGK